MPNLNDLLKFPSGRNVKRLKQDAKEISRRLKIPLHQALNEIAKLNGSNLDWSQTINALQCQSVNSKNIIHIRPQSKLSEELGITDSELDDLTWETDANASNDGLIYDYVLKFDEDNPSEILDKINGLSDNLTTRVSANVFDVPPDQSEGIEASSHVQTDMNPYRKLMVLALNELISRGVLSLEWDGASNEETRHIETILAEQNTIIIWSGIGFGEVMISVWWKYDHSKHPQANLKGNSRESFSCSSPLAKRQHYPKFVGLVCSAWLERKEGKYLQGERDSSLFERYARKGELDYFKMMPNPVPLGFEPEGRFHM